MFSIKTDSGFISYSVDEISVTVNHTKIINISADLCKEIEYHGATPNLNPNPDPSLCQNIENKQQIYSYKQPIREIYKIPNHKFFEEKITAKDIKNGFIETVLDNKLISRRYFKNDILDGESAFYVDNIKDTLFIYDNGKLIKMMTLFPYGSIKSEQNYHDGMMHGENIEYYPICRRKFYTTYLFGFMQYHEVYNEDLIKIKAYKYHDDGMVDIFVLKDRQCRNCILDDGEIIVWKACMIPSTKQLGFAELRIPKEAKRITLADHNDLFISRVQYGYINSISDQDNINYDMAIPLIIDKTTNYILNVGKIITADNYTDETISTISTIGIEVHKFKDHCKNYFNQSLISA